MYPMLQPEFGRWPSPTSAYRPESFGVHVHAMDVHTPGFAAVLVPGNECFFLFLALPKGCRNFELVRSDVFGAQCCLQPWESFFNCPNSSITQAKLLSCQQTDAILDTNSLIYRRWCWNLKHALGLRNSWSNWAKFWYLGFLWALRLCCQWIPAMRGMFWKCKNCWTHLNLFSERLSVTSHRAQSVRFGVANIMLLRFCN